MSIDPRITYPCYKPLDDFIDIGALRALDGYVLEGIKRHISVQRDTAFYTGPYRLDDTEPDTPGSRMIYLAQSQQPDNYFDLDRVELWQPTAEAEEFECLVGFIKTLPFAATGRTLIIYDDVERAGPAHRDHLDAERCHEFIWFRTNLRKPFYMLNPETQQKRYVSSYSAWFDTVNQFHGTDAQDGITFSIRVDGVFTDEFRRKIPAPVVNRASTPALWACIENDN